MKIGLIHVVCISIPDHVKFITDPCIWINLDYTKSSRTDSKCQPGQGERTISIETEDNFQVKDTRSYLWRAWLQNWKN